MKKFFYAVMLLLSLSVVFNSCEKENKEEIKDKVWVIDRIEYVFQDKVVQTGPVVFGMPGNRSSLTSVEFPKGTKLCFSPNGTLSVIWPDGEQSSMKYSSTDKGYKIGEYEFSVSANGELTVPYKWAGLGHDMNKWREQDIIKVGNYNGPGILTNIRIAKYLTGLYRPVNELTVYSEDWSELPFFYQYKNGTRVPCTLVGLTFKREEYYEPLQGIYPPAFYDSANKKIYWWWHEWLVEDGNEFAGEDLWRDEYLNQVGPCNVITFTSFDYAYEYKQVVFKPE